MLTKDEESAESIDDIWASADQMATVGIFVILLGTCLYVGRTILLPVVAAIVIGTTLAPLVKAAARYRASPWLTAGVLAVALVAATGTAATFLAKPVTDWIARAPEIGATIKQKLYVLDRPLAAMRELQEVLLPSHGNAVAVEPSQLGIVTPVLAFLTPAVLELVLFFVTLIFFLAAQMDFRRYMASFFTTRDAKLRFIRITNDIEQNLVSYLVTLTVINFCLGATVAIGAWLFGFSSPILFGVLAAVLNYIPYLGAACTVWSGSRELSLIGLCVRPAGCLRGTRHNRGPVHHADRPGSSINAQSACGALGARFLVLGMGSDGRISCRSAHDYRICHTPSPFSAR